MYAAIRSLLFHLDPETAHHLTLRMLHLAAAVPPIKAILRRVYCLEDPRLHVHAFGLDFPNPIGLAAGYDKEGMGLHGLPCLGFGHFELGTVTLKGQPGNPRPRIFRLPEDQALINRMGFPNSGADPLLRRLRHGQPRGIVLGINIGKGIDTPLDQAAGDYVRLMRAFHPYADYLAVNVSSPNTVGLRRLQARRSLEDLLAALKAERERLQAEGDRHLPVLVKLAPDLSSDELEEAVEAIQGAGMDGIIATNTTLARSGLGSIHREQAGGLSGKPLYLRALEVVEQIHAKTQGAMPIIGVGGIFDHEDARKMLRAGASLVQVYSGLVYRGPGMVRQILTGLRSEL